MPLIAGTVQLDSVVQLLAKVRPVFHSEADFQHAFGQALHSLDPALRVRLEVPQAEYDNGRWYIDMVCHGPARSTAVEFKYFTAAWTGEAPATGEAFRLREHAATDLARRNFVFDIARLEHLCARALDTDGITLMLTNAPSLWRPLRSQRPTGDHEFRIHEGQILTGTLRWGGALYPGNQRKLIGTYPLQWQDYTRLPGRNGTFRWLAATIDPHG
ncbi:hypothetical protein [Actinokineospora sp. HUAS TT18]|uniref:hypothetical protein n=1 Tax=Actinokineospora sp. HUAS TT18 TaxID=3447451 RepID=UPI003F51FE64